MGDVPCWYGGGDVLARQTAERTDGNGGVYRLDHATSSTEVKAMHGRTPMKSNPYYLPKNMYLAAVRYCLQYPELKVQLEQAQLRAGLKGVTYSDMPKGGEVTSTTEAQAIRIAELSRKIRIIEETVREVAPDISPWLLEGVCYETSYEFLNAINKMPCGRRQYHRYRQVVFYKISQKI